MARPLVIAHHLMWTVYGWWLPNDPRGSTSQTIRSEVLAAFGDIHHGRKEFQPTGREIQSFYQRVRPELKHEMLRWRNDQISAVAEAVGEAVKAYGYTCYAAAVMPDHVHLLIRKHRDSAEQMIKNLQLRTSALLRDAGLRPAMHPVWTSGGWKVFCDHPDEIERTIRYVEANPDSYHLPRQHWEWVKTYDRWPLHVGHSPRSPYVKRLKADGRYPR